ncbi:transcription initiation factor TFIID subunit 10-like isoform X2 [Argiope bruennichi]|nr:transcription initiation factor TFIID subunit 10-like isoform X2 [Argiope bruennichi]
MDPYAEETKPAGSASTNGLQPKPSSNQASNGESLSEFVSQLDNYPSSIPDSVASFFMQSAGLPTPDPRILRLISIAAHKFVIDIANDAMQHSKAKVTDQAERTKRSKGPVLTMDDLSASLADRGINVKKPPYSK